MTQRYKAGVAHYRGDVRHMIGQLAGPTTYGAVLLAVAAEYHHGEDRTRVYFAHGTLVDQKDMVRDEFGVARVRSHIIHREASA